MAAVSVHHWDGSFDGVAALSASKEHVPADGTRFDQGNPSPADGIRFGQDMRLSLMTTVLSTMIT